MKRIALLCPTLFMTLLLGGTGTAMAAGINLDFGSEYGTPESTFSAASEQTGYWNDITDSFTTYGILDTNGVAADITIHIVTHSMSGGCGPNCPIPIPQGTDLLKLVGDNFFGHSAGQEDWTVSITGLLDGLYDIYLYEPNHPSVGSGVGTLNGVDFAFINGGYGGQTFTEGFNYHHLRGVPVSGGTILAHGAELGGIPFPGLAAMQIVPVPEPTTALLVSLGLVALSFRRHLRIEPDRVR